MLFGVVAVGVDSHHDRDVGIGGRRRDDDLARTAAQVFGGRLAGSEKPGALGDDIDTDPAPVELFRVADGGVGHPPAVDLDGVVFGADLRVEPAVHRVVFQQVRHGGGVGQVVDGGHLHVRVLHRRPEYQPSDASETVDSQFDAHSIPSIRCMPDAGLRRPLLCAGARCVIDVMSVANVSRDILRRRPAAASLSASLSRACFP